MLDVPGRAALSTTEILARATGVLSDMALEMTQDLSRFEIEHQALTAAAATDDLTGLANRRYFDIFLLSQVEIARRYNAPLSLVLVDLDHFKAINDAHGHLTGDLVLREAARTLRDQVRAADLVARYGGEEFAIVLPETTLPGATGMAKRMRRAIERGRWQTVDGEPLRVTASFGVASVGQPSTEPPSALIASADTALYQAKAAGRNRVRAAAS